MSAHRDALEPLGMLLSAVQLERLEHTAETHDNTHLFRFCSKAMDRLAPDVSAQRIENLTSLMPEFHGILKKAALAARTQFAIGVVEDLHLYGIDINARLSEDDLRKGRAIIKLLLAYPLHRSKLTPCQNDSDDSLIEFFLSHTDHVDDIIAVCMGNEDRLEADYLEGYLDKTAPSLRDGYL